jgi:hypothetical protein
MQVDERERERGRGGEREKGRKAFKRKGRREGAKDAEDDLTLEHEL